MCSASTPSGKRAGREQTIRSLLIAAERLSTRQQPASFSVRDIATEAGVSTGLLYFYFPSKEALILATLQSMATDVGALLEDIDGIGRIVDIASAFLVERPAFPRLLAWVLLEGGDFAELRDDPILTRLKDEFGDLGVSDPATSAGVVVTMLLGNALYQPGVNTAIERDPNDEGLGNALKRQVMAYLASCAATDRDERQRR